MNMAPVEPTPPALAEFTDYEGLRQALNAVREYRDISMELLDDLAGAPKGYFAKILGPSQPTIPSDKGKRPRPACRRIGMQSLGWAFGGLGVKCVILEDPKALARIKGRLEPRDRAQIRHMLTNGKQHVVTARFLKKISKLGVVGRNAERKRKAIRKAAAKKASSARWERPRLAKDHGLTAQS